VIQYKYKYNEIINQYINDFLPIKDKTIYFRDNLSMLKDIPGKSIDLCHIDPPFNSGRDYEVFWEDCKRRGILIISLKMQKYIFYICKLE